MKQVQLDHEIKCGVCGGPVLFEHDPNPTYSRLSLLAADGAIHGKWDCMDEARCDEAVEGRSSGGEVYMRCRLTVGHVDAGVECVGEPD